MSDFLTKIIRLTKEQYAQLVADGSITVGGVTYTYDPNALYLTDQEQELTIGTVTTLPAGSSATATITGTTEQPVLNLGIPRGQQGDPGDDYILTAADKSEIAELAAGELIDDTAGVGDTDKVWSADKLAPISEDVDDLKSALNDKYTKPSGGIPASDLAESYIEEPQTQGTAGQVLTSDGQGGQSWETPSGGGDVTDVQVNGVSVLSQGVANVPVASNNEYGVVKAGGYGVYPYYGSLRLETPSLAESKAGTSSVKAISPQQQHQSTFYGLAKAAGDATQSASSNAVGTYTESAKSAISEMLGGSVAVSGTTPTINAMPGISYVCGEVSTIDIVTPASGIVDVVFESGTTPTVLTVTPPTGMTMKWANGFDPTSLEANTTYEINIMNGCLGVAGTWT